MAAADKDCNAMEKSMEQEQEQEQRVGDQPEAKAENKAEINEWIAQLVREKDDLMETRDKIVEDLRPLQEQIALLRGSDIEMDICNASVEVCGQKVDQKLSDLNKEIEALCALVEHVYK